MTTLTAKIEAYPRFRFARHHHSPGECGLVVEHTDTIDGAGVRGLPTFTALIIERSDNTGVSVTNAAAQLQLELRDHLMGTRAAASNDRPIRCFEVYAYRIREEIAAGRPPLDPLACEIVAPLPIGEVTWKPIAKEDRSLVLRLTRKADEQGIL